VFAHACRLGAEGIVSKKIDGAYQRVASSRSAIRPASRAAGAQRDEEQVIPTGYTPRDRNAPGMAGVGLL
jgi:ATP-dependent DNA ligase